MSQEVRLAHQCPHLVIEESAPLADDEQSLVVMAPVASATAVSVLANDLYKVPSSGLYSQAQIVSGIGGPFRITDCTNSLTVTTNTETVTVTLPSRLVQTEAVARLLVGSLHSVAVEAVRGRLILTDTGSVGQSSRILLSGTALDVLGFGNQRGARGQMVYPAWVLQTGKTVLGNNKYPRFVQPIRARDTAWKVTYVTSQSRCPRCQGTGVENDAQFDLTGNTIMITDADLLYQASLKILLTQIQSNPYHPGYGTSLMSRIGTKMVGAVSLQLQADVQQALQMFQKLQSDQARGGQQVSAKERLYRVLSINVKPHPIDTAAFQIDVSVQNASGDPVALSVVFTVPGAIALAGSNGLSLGLG